MESQIDLEKLREEIEDCLYETEKREESLYQDYYKKLYKRKEDPEYKGNQFKEIERLLKTKKKLAIIKEEGARKLREIKLRM